jgi:hypothetical protein
MCFFAVFMTTSRLTSSNSLRLVWPGWWSQSFFSKQLSGLVLSTTPYYFFSYPVGHVPCVGHFYVLWLTLSHAYMNMFRSIFWVKQTWQECTTGSSEPWCLHRPVIGCVILVMSAFEDNSWKLLRNTITRYSYFIYVWVWNYGGLWSIVPLVN